MSVAIQRRGLGKITNTDMLPGIGIFGTGNMVQIIVPYLKKKGFKVLAIWGRTIIKAESIGKRLDIPYFTNKMDDVLLHKDVDFVFIMCSPNLQSQIAVKALGIGKHVLCDKPAGLSQSESIKMVRAAQYYPSLISLINHSLRFLPAFRHMKRSINEGYIGSEILIMDIRVQMGSLRMERYNWLHDADMGGGILTLVGSHVIDLINFLTGSKAVRVHGVVKTFQNTECGIRRITSPDFCSFQMELENGAIVTCTLNSHLPNVYHQEVLICGKEGHLVVRGGDLYGFKKGSAKEEVIYLEVEDLQQTETTATAHIIPKLYVKGLFRMISSLKEAFQPVEDKSGWIKEPVADASTFEDGLYVQAVIDALMKSNEHKEWTVVKVITEEPDPNPLLSAAVRRTGIATH